MLYQSFCNTFGITWDNWGSAAGDGGIVHSQALPCGVYL